jgi:hypothetical protein
MWCVPSRHEGVVHRSGNLLGTPRAGLSDRADEGSTGDQKRALTLRSKMLGLDLFRNKLGGLSLGVRGCEDD